MHDEQFTIRRARSSDSEALRELISSLGYPDLDPESFKTTFAVVCQHPEMVVLVVEGLNGKTVGCLTMSSKPQLRLGGMLVTIDELVIATEFRGKGLGRSLLVQAQAIALEIGARWIELHTRRARESYQRGFYAKNGFVEMDSALMRFHAPYET